MGSESEAVYSQWEPGIEYRLDHEAVLLFRQLLVDLLQVLDDVLAPLVLPRQLDLLVSESVYLALLRVYLVPVLPQLDINLRF